MNTLTIFCNRQGSHLLISGKYSRIKPFRVQTNRIDIYMVTVVAPYFKFLNQRYISANTPKSNEPAIYLSQRYIPNNVTLKKRTVCILRPVPAFGWAPVIEVDGFSEKRRIASSQWQHGLRQYQITCSNQVKWKQLFSFIEKKHAFLLFQRPFQCSISDIVTRNCIQFVESQ